MVHRALIKCSVSYNKSSSRIPSTNCHNNRNILSFLMASGLWLDRTPAGSAKIPLAADSCPHLSLFSHRTKFQGPKRNLVCCLSNTVILRGCFQFWYCRGHSRVNPPLGYSMQICDLTHGNLFPLFPARNNANLSASRLLFYLVTPSDLWEFEKHISLQLETKSPAPLQPLSLILLRIFLSMAKLFT